MTSGPDRFTYFNRIQSKLLQIPGISRVEDAGENDDGSVEFDIYLSAETARRVEEQRQESRQSDWLQSIKQAIRERTGGEFDLQSFDESQSVLRVKIPYDP